MAARRAPFSATHGFWLVLTCSKRSWCVRDHSHSRRPHGELYGVGYNDCCSAEGRSGKNLFLGYGGGDHLGFVHFYAADPTRQRYSRTRTTTHRAWLESNGIPFSRIGISSSSTWIDAPSLSRRHQRTGGSGGTCIELQASRLLQTPKV